MISHSCLIQLDFLSCKVQEMQSLISVDPVILLVLINKPKLRVRLFR